MARRQRKAIPRFRELTRDVQRGTQASITKTLDAKDFFVEHFPRVTSFAGKKRITSWFLRHATEADGLPVFVRKVRAGSGTS